MTADTADFDDTFMPLLRILLGYFGLDLPSTMTSQQAMAAMTSQYQAHGTPANLSIIDRATLISAILECESLLPQAPPSIDPGVLSAFDQTLRQMYNDLVPPSRPSN